MSLKLRTVIVDDDPLSVAILEDYITDSPLAEVTATFNNPKEFLDSRSTLKFDLAVLDIVMPEMEGTMVAKVLKDTPIIFVTGVFEKLREALEISPIDIVTKPIYKARLDKALGKAYVLTARREEYRTFTVAEASGKVKLCIPDILLVVNDSDYSRHKKIYMRDGKVHTLMHYTMDELLNTCPLLVQVNREIAVSLEAVNEVEHNCITLKDIPSNIPGEISVGRPFRKSMLDKLAYF